MCHESAAMPCVRPCKQKAKHLSEHFHVFHVQHSIWNPMEHKRKTTQSQRLQVPQLAPVGPATLGGRASASCNMKSMEPNGQELRIVIQAWLRGQHHGLPGFDDFIFIARVLAKPSKHSHIHPFAAALSWSKLFGKSLAAKLAMHLFFLD